MWNCRWHRKQEELRRQDIQLGLVRFISTDIIEVDMVHVQTCLTPCRSIISWKISPPLLPMNDSSISGVRGFTRGCTWLPSFVSAVLKAGAGTSRGLHYVISRQYKFPHDSDLGGQTYTAAAVVWVLTPVGPFLEFTADTTADEVKRRCWHWTRGTWARALTALEACLVRIMVMIVPCLVDTIEPAAGRRNEKHNLSFPVVNLSSPG